MIIMEGYLNKMTNKEFIKDVKSRLVENRLYYGNDQRIVLESLFVFG